MKILLICDTHAGARQDNQVFYPYQKKFYDNILFPFIERYKIKTLVHLGDIVDDRKQMNYRTLRHLREDFLNPLQSLNIDCHFIVGNHDSFYKTDLTINAVSEFVKFGKIYDQCGDVRTYDGNDILMVPWICRDNRNEILNRIKESSSRYCFGHLELNDFVMNNGSICRNGESINTFKSFDIVFSGHFHKRSTQGNIQYLGAAFQYTWGEYGDPKGFAIFDTKTGDIEYYKNPYSIFSVLNYDECNLSNIKLVKDTYCRIYVKRKSSQINLNDFIKKVEDIGPIQLTVIDETDMVITENIDIENFDDIRLKSHSYIDAIKVSDVDLVKQKFDNIYYKGVKINE